MRYFKGILFGDKRRWVGHNPASSWAAVMMMVLALGLGITGYLMVSGENKETFEDLHEILSNSFIAVVVLHILGIVLHTFRLHEKIGLSMIHGKKEQVSIDQAIPSARPAIGILLLGLMLAFSLHLFKNYDRQSNQLHLFGANLQLGDTEENGDNEDEEGEF